MPSPIPKPAPFAWRCDRHAGFTFSYRLYLRDEDGLETGPLDLAGYQARMQVREENDEAATLLGTMDSQAVPATITFTESGVYAGIVDTISGGLPDTLTGLLPVDRAWADIRMIPPTGDAWYLFRGPFVIDETVTTP